MEMRIIREVWQAMSILSDVQEDLGGQDPEADAKLNHAKRHLAVALQWSQEGNQDAFLEAIRVIECTLE